MDSQQREDVSADEQEQRNSKLTRSTKSQSVAPKIDGVFDGPAFTVQVVSTRRAANRCDEPPVKNLFQASLNTFLDGSDFMLTGVPVLLSTGVEDADASTAGEERLMEDAMRKGEHMARRCSCPAVGSYQPFDTADPSTWIKDSWKSNSKTSRRHKSKSQRRTTIPVNEEDGEIKTASRRRRRTTVPMFNSYILEQQELDAHHTLENTDAKSNVLETNAEYDCRQTNENLGDTTSEEQEGFILTLHGITDRKQEEHSTSSLEMDGQRDERCARRQEEYRTSSLEMDGQRDERCSRRPSLYVLEQSESSDYRGHHMHENDASPTHEEENEMMNNFLQVLEQIANQNEQQGDQANTLERKEEDVESRRLDSFPFERKETNEKGEHLSNEDKEKMMRNFLTVFGDNNDHKEDKKYLKAKKKRSPSRREGEDDESEEQRRDMKGRRSPRSSSLGRRGDEKRKTERKGMKPRRSHSSHSQSR